MRNREKPPEKGTAESLESDPTLRWRHELEMKQEKKQIGDREGNPSYLKSVFELQDCLDKDSRKSDNGKPCITN